MHWVAIHAIGFFLIKIKLEKAVEVLEHRTTEKAVKAGFEHI